MPRRVNLPGDLVAERDRNGREPWVGARASRSGLDVDRLDVEQSPADGQGQLVAEDDAGPRRRGRRDELRQGQLPPERRVVGGDRRGAHVVVDLPRTVDRPTRRLEQAQLAVVRRLLAVLATGVAVDGEEARQHVAVTGRHERRREREGRARLVRHGEREVVRRLHEVVGRLRRVVGHAPEVLTTVERARHGVVVLLQQAALDLEEVLGIAQVRHERALDVAERLHGSGEDRHPGLEHGSCSSHW